MTTDSRGDMVRSAAALLARQGMTATSFSEVVAHSGAPRGSIYHHFPGGKEQLTREAVELAGGYVLSRQGACGATTAAGVIECFVDLWRQVVVGSKGASGCAVAGVAIDAGEDEAELLALTRSTFRAWTDLLATQLAAAGLPAGRASSVSTITLASMEGALILCRAEGDVAPLEAVADELGRLVAG